MKRFFKTVAMLLLCGALMTPAVDAQQRGRNNGTGSTPQKTSPAKPATTPNRPGNSGTGNSNTGQRPGQQPGNSNQRPGQQPPGNSNQRPGQQPPGQQPPGQQPPGNSNQRPGQQPPGNSSQRPGQQPPGRPGGMIGNNPPNYRPKPNNNRPPMRPNMPALPPVWSRPTPPPSWRPPTTWNPFRTILGIALGTSFNVSIHSLINSGYTVTHYGDNNVYLSNVAMLNMMWPNAVMCYNNYGLCGSRFIYATGFQDMTRYNSVYATLVSNYGAPFSVQNTVYGIEATWWGTGNQFITLSYGPEYVTQNSIKYFTILSFGN